MLCFYQREKYSNKIAFLFTVSWPLTFVHIFLVNLWSVCTNSWLVKHFPMEGRKEMFYLTTHSTHFIYGYMASDIWLRTILTRCHHIGYSFRLAARLLLYAPSHRQDSTYHGLCYTSRGALAGTRNSSVGPPHEGSIRRPIAPFFQWRSLQAPVTCHQLPSFSFALAVQTSFSSLKILSKTLLFWTQYILPELISSDRLVLLSVIFHLRFSQHEKYSNKIACLFVYSWLYYIC